jgi:hypothetical protein
MPAAPHGLRPADERAEELPPAAQQDAGHPEHGSRPAWKPPPARWARASPTPWAWRWPKNCWRPNSTAPATPVVDHHTYAFMGDGCLMEGISHEACALAGAWKLNKLIALYDDNGISIDGQVAPWFVDNTAERFEAYQWNVIGPIDGHDVDAVDQRHCRRQAKRRQAHADHLPRPTSAKAARTAQDTAKAHGEPLGAERDQADARGARLAARPVRDPRDRLRRWDAKVRRRRAEAEKAGKRFAAYKAKRTPRLAPNFPPHGGRAAEELAQVAVDAAVDQPTEGRDRGQRARPARSRWKPSPPPARTAGRQCRPDRLQPDQHQEHAAAALQRRLARLPEPKPDREAQLARGTNGVGKETTQQRRRAAVAATSTTACANSAWPPS